jgi:hypothetical protein
MIKENIDMNQKTLLTIMKRFLSSKKDDPDWIKYFQAVDGVDFLATSDGSAVNLEFENKYDARSGEVKFLSPLPKGEMGEADDIPDYPNVKGVFDVNWSQYSSVTLTDITKLIHLHEAMHKVKTLGGSYHSAMMSINNVFGLEISLYDNAVEMNFVDDIGDVDVELNFTYDIELMIAILKGLKDLKVDSFEIHYRYSADRIFITSSNTGYNFKFALAEKMVR